MSQGIHVKALLSGSDLGWLWGLRKEEVAAAVAASRQQRLQQQQQQQQAVHVGEQHGKGLGLLRAQEGTHGDKGTNYGVQLSPSKL